MRIAELLEAEVRQKLPPQQRKVLTYLEQHPDEVFTARDEILVERFHAQPSGIAHSLWALHKTGLLDKEIVSGRLYYGSPEAISWLRMRRSKPDQEEVYRRIDENRERIRAEAGGNVGSLEILEELRSYRDRP
jgi:hypothetical protein